MLRIKAFECKVSNHEDIKGIVNAPSRGKAKSIFYNRLRDAECMVSTPCGDEYIQYKDICCKTKGNPVTDERFVHCASRRGVPFAKIGMQVMVNGEVGAIVGSNDSLNFDVILEDGRILNCHPNWKMQFLEDDRNKG